MSEYYCHECGAKLGHGGPVDPERCFSSNSYQVDKYMKHTVPPSCSGMVSIFDDPDFQQYRDYIINTAASGCVEIDNKGRTNMVWYAGRENGFLFVDGELVSPTDAVKLVLREDEDKIHAFPTGSAEISTKRCALCGSPVID
ncbi:MAG: hypothetical protein ACP5FL_03920 [Thermoplasmatota archaeon]